MLAGCSIRKLKKDQLLILFLTGVLAGGDRTSFRRGKDRRARR